MSARPGIVYLVGAGPGDPGLMTRRSLDLIATADAILYDRLIPEGALDGARTDAELLYVGKAPGNAAISQEEIAEEMAERAGRGLSVVRLKGGDPFVFGRGGEEAEALRAAGIEFEVVPGVTAGVAAPAYAGIPVTHRDDASAVAFVTGHEDPDKEETALDWDSLARFGGTLVLYMGVKNLPVIAERLIAAGRDPSEPAAAIERGTMPGQRVVLATLATLASAVAESDLKPPSILIFGQVAARHDQIAWLDHRPLHGKRVVVTRARAQASELAATLRGLGADVVQLPVIRIESRISEPAVGLAIRAIAEYGLVCVTSPNGARLLFEALAESGLDARALAGVKVAAIGRGTARSLASGGIAADIVPDKFVAEELVRAIDEAGVAPCRALIARAAEARDVLPDSLRDRGFETEVLALYETVREQPDASVIAAALTADYLTFTSSSTVSNFLEVSGGEVPSAARVVSIGPITSETLRAAGVRVDVEAAQHDPEGLVQALIDDVS